MQHKPPMRMRNFFPLPSPPIANLGRLLERQALYFYLLKRKVIEAAHSGKLTLGKGISMKNLTKGVVVINRWWGGGGGNIVMGISSRQQSIIGVLNISR